MQQINTDEMGGTSMLVWIYERIRSAERHKREWLDNIKIDHKEIGYECTDWIPLA
jgi:hypothetical protein